MTVPSNETPTGRPSLSDEQALDLAQKRAEELDSGKVEALDYRKEMERMRLFLSP